MQGPCICATAIALKEAGFENPFQLVVYGTPAEETRSAKVSMWESGYFRDMDVALMMHGGPDTCVDEKSLALTNYLVVFKGQGAHAALAPEKGRSALDALLLAFNGMEFLREHVREDTRMHYTIKETPGPTNVVPARAVGEFSLRSYSREVLNDVCRRFEQIIQGAALMADVEYEITKEKSLDNKVPCYPLNEIIMDNAAACGAPRSGSGPEEDGQHRLRQRDQPHARLLYPGEVCAHRYFQPYPGICGCGQEPGGSRRYPVRCQDSGRNGLRPDLPAGTGQGALGCV